MTGLIARLIEAGTPAHLVEEVAMELARARVAEEAIEKRRAADRNRQSARRHVTSRDTADVTDMVSPQSPPLKNPPDPLKITPPLTPHPNLEERARKCRFAAPVGVTDEQFTAFRQQRKKPLNERSYTLLVNKLRDLAEHGYPPGEMIDLAIERGWETVFEPKGQGNGRTNSMGRNHGAGHSTSGMGRTVDAAQLFIARGAG